MATTLACGVTVADPGDAPGSLLTGPRQIEWAGMLMGSGTPIRWKTLSGWDGMPGVDLSDTARPAGHGDIPGRGLFGPKLPTLEFFTEADTIPLMEELLQLLQDRLLYTDTEQPLYVRDGARTLWAPARVLQADVPMNSLRTVGRTDQAVQWKVSAGLRYSPTVQQVTLSPAVVSGQGLSYPLAYPLDYGPIASSSSTGILGNAGNAAAPPVADFYGPVGAGYGLMLAGVGALRFDLPLAAGDRLTVDTAAATVLLNGATDRVTALTDDSLPPEAWLIPAKASAGVALVTPSGAGDGTRATIRWADTYR